MFSCTDQSVHLDIIGYKQYRIFAEYYFSTDASYYISLEKMLSCTQWLHIKRIVVQQLSKFMDRGEFIHGVSSDDTITDDRALRVQVLVRNFDPIRKQYAKLLYPTTIHVVGDQMVKVIVNRNNQPGQVARLVTAFSAHGSLHPAIQAALAIPPLDFRSRIGNVGKSGKEANRDGIGDHSAKKNSLKRSTVAYDLAETIHQNVGARIGALRSKNIDNRPKHNDGQSAMKRTTMSTFVTSTITSAAGTMDQFDSSGNTIVDATMSMVTHKSPAKKRSSTVTNWKGEAECSSGDQMENVLYDTSDVDQDSESMLEGLLAAVHNDDMDVGIGQLACGSEPIYAARTIHVLENTVVVDPRLDPVHIIKAMMENMSFVLPVYLAWYNDRSLVEEMPENFIIPKDVDVTEVVQRLSNSLIGAVGLPSHSIVAAMQIGGFIRDIVVRHYYRTVLNMLRGD